MKGSVITNILIAVGTGMFGLLVGWNGWLTNGLVAQGRDLSSVSAMAVAYQTAQKSHDDANDARFMRIEDKLDWLVERNGANPRIFASTTVSDLTR